jgi:glycosyltransferase involved in cell wall biosynthesis
LKVLFLAPQPFFEVRGTPLAVRALVSTLLDLGHEVDLLTFPQGETLRRTGLRHLRSLKLPVGRVRAGASLAKLILDGPFMLEAVVRMTIGGYDAVHAVEEAAHLAAPWARLLGLPLVADVDSSIPHQLRYSGFARRGPLPFLADRLETYAFRKAAAVVTVCGSLTVGVRAKAPEARIFQIEDPPLVDPNTPLPVEAGSALRPSLGLGPDPVVLYSGNFEPYQGVGLLVEAAARVREAQFLFMGGEEHEADSFRAQAEASGARCVFAGKRPPSELPAFLAAADLLVSPRIQGENTPFKLYTYLASGKPVVATRIPTHTQLLTDALAYLVEPTAEGLAGGIRAALQDPEGARAKGSAGRAVIARDYSTERYRDKVERAYASLEGSRPDSSWSG